ncbi:MerC domain-containing protein [Altererythrobacter lauratis]|uniref:MerC domain-containing protein n=1 Tax=Alteraurantiacibacter lauratis TaxID=2054627 RepID=A0ABV7EJ01_9SPHN
MSGDSHTRRANLIEGAAASASLLCLLHCLALPVLFLASPGLIRFIPDSPLLHLLALAFVLPFALGAFWLGFRQHRQAGPGLAGLGAIALLAISLWNGWSPVLEHALSIVGSALLIAAHVRNWRLRRCPL